MQSSLVLGCEQPVTGYHETNHSMAYSSHIAWQNETSPVPMETYPALAFDSLFDNGGTKRNRSILDSVQEDARSLSRRVSSSDVAKLDEYLLFLSNMWSGTVHDSTKVPVVQIGSLGGTLETGRVLDYSDKGDENRKLCSMYLSIMDRMGVSLEKFGDAETRLAGL